jgi:hypothetical protein
MSSNSNFFFPSKSRVSYIDISIDIDIDIEIHMIEQISINSESFDPLPIQTVYLPSHSQSSARCLATGLIREMWYSQKARSIIVSSASFPINRIFCISSWRIWIESSQCKATMMFAAER